MNLSNHVDHPNHYKLGNSGLEVLDIIEMSMTKDNYLGFLLGNVIKYVLRWNRKNGVEDLKKARNYLEWAIEKLEGK